METFMDYFWLALSGVMGIAVHLFFKWRDAWTKKVKFIWGDHIVNSISGVIVVTILLLFADMMSDFYPLNKATMFFSGYFADSVWKNITKFGAKQIKL